MPFDRFDKAILQALQHEARIPNSTLAERVSLSESACMRRVRKLEESGLIEGYTALINQQKAGCPVNVFVNITLERQDESDLRRFEEAVRRLPEVMECYLMTGDYDYLVRVVVTDTADFERLHSRHLTRLPGVARVHSSFALRTVADTSSKPDAATTNQGNTPAHDAGAKEDENNFETLLAAYEGRTQIFSEGEVIRGKVIAISGGGVIVDVGFKSEGIKRSGGVERVLLFSPGSCVETMGTWKQRGRWF